MDEHQININLKLVYKDGKVLVKAIDLSDIPVVLAADILGAIENSIKDFYKNENKLQ